MAHLLFAAHDPGGARYLSAVAGAARARGDTVSFLAAGAALTLWTADGEEVHVSVDNVAAPDVLVTGTGFGDFERSLWPRFKSLAMIDAWTNFTLRFKASDGSMHLPDAIAVIDHESSQRLQDKPWCTVPVFVTGQPHLETVIPEIISGRHRRTGPSGDVVFFSEPINADFGREVRGYDQYEIASAIMDRLDGLRLLIKPHPREDAKDWRTKMAGRNVIVTDAQTSDLLITTDGVLGMTTMVLLEAGLAGVPCLSLQMGRLQSGNPAVDRYIPVVTEADELGAALGEFKDKLGDVETPTHQGLFSGATDKCLAAIDATLG